MLPRFGLLLNLVSLVVTLIFVTSGPVVAFRKLKVRLLPTSQRSDVKEV